MHSDLRLCKGGSDRSACFENLRELLEGAAARLDVEKVDEGEFKHVPEDEEEVVL